MSLPEFSSLLQIVSQDVQEQLGIGIGVDVSVSNFVHEVSQLTSIGQVAVLTRSLARPHVHPKVATYMGKCDAVR